MKKSEFLAIIPARGGSKGIPYKNIKEFCGKPLITHILATAQQSRVLGRIVVSTEDPQIRRVAEGMGVEVIERPMELAEDTVPTLPVLLHAVEVLASTSNYRPDHVVLLYATSPLLSTATLDRALRDYLSSKADSCVGVVESYDKFWQKKGIYGELLYPPKRLNRQQMKPLYRESGSLYVVQTDLLMANKTLFGGRSHLAIIPLSECVDIDTPEDFLYAENLYRQKKP